MKPDYPRYIISVLIVILVAWIISCSGRPGNITRPDRGSADISSTTEAADLIKMKSPDENAGYKLKAQVNVNVIPADQEKLIDSVKVYFDGKEVSVLKSAPWECFAGSSFDKPDRKEIGKSGSIQRRKSHRQLRVS